MINATSDSTLNFPRAAEIQMSWPGADPMQAGRCPCRDIDGYQCLCSLNAAFVIVIVCLLRKEARVDLKVGVPCVHVFVDTCPSLHAYMSMMMTNIPTKSMIFPNVLCSRG